MRTPVASLSRIVVLQLCALLLPARSAPAQSAPSLADLRWSAEETPAGRYVIVPGQRGFVGGYNSSGFEVWASPLQLLLSIR